MLLPIIATITALGLAGWVIYIASRSIRPLLAGSSARREAARDLIRRDPADFVRAFFARLAPARMKLEHKGALSAVGVERAQARETRLLSGFANGEPSHRAVVLVLAMALIWVIAIIAAARIDIPIIVAISGGDLVSGILGTLLALCVPALSSIFLAELVTKRRAGMGPVAFSLAVTGVLVAFLSVVAVLTALAPIRAQIEYQDAIRTTTQQIAMYSEDGDDNALAFAQQHLAELEAQQQRSAEWNSALVPIAAAVEFASGFAVPAAIPILQLRSARRSKREFQQQQRSAQDRIAAHRAREFGNLSAAFQDAGVTQLELQRAVAAMAAVNGIPAAGADPVAEVVETLAAEFPATPPAATEAAAPSAPPPPVAPALVRDAPQSDDSFDLS